MREVYMILFLYFVQAEDGIRNYRVTVVQTCALPIWARRHPGKISAPRPSRGHGTEQSAGQDRKSVVEGKGVDLGGGRIIKKKQHTDNTLSSGPARRHRRAGQSPRGPQRP